MITGKTPLSSTVFLGLRDDSAETSLRIHAAQSVAEHPQLEPLRFFTIVGSNGIDLKAGKDVDTQRFYSLFCYLINSGIPIHPDFELDEVNLNLGRDFLKEVKKTDVAFISSVPMAGLRELIPSNADPDEFNRLMALYAPNEADILRIQQKLQAGDKAGARALMEANALKVSALASPAEWKQRLGTTESKLVFSFLAGAEVDLRVTMPDGFVPLGRTHHELDPDTTSISADMYPFQVIGRRDFALQYLIAHMMDGNKRASQTILSRQMMGLFADLSEDEAEALHMALQLQKMPKDPQHLPQQPTMPSPSLIKKSKNDATAG